MAVGSIQISSRKNISALTPTVDSARVMGAELSSDSLTERLEVICNPIGCADLDSTEAYCPYSKNSQDKDKKQKTCNYKYYLFLSLFVPDKETGDPVPLNKALGFEVRYGISSGSETCGMEIGQALDAAADYLDGNIHQISGILYFAKKGKHYVAENKKQTAYVPQIYMVLSPADIGQRKQENRAMLLEDRSFQAALPAPSIAENPEYVDLEPDLPGEPSPSPADESTSPFNDGSEEPVSAANASDEDLADALVAHSGDQLGEIAYFEFNGKKYNIDDINWFFDGVGEDKDRERRKILRDICLRIEATPNTTFQILPFKDVSGGEEAGQ